MPSLKPIRLKKRTRTTRSKRSKKKAAAPQWLAPQWLTSTPVIVATALAVVGGAVMIAAYQSAEPTHASVVKSSEATLSDQVEPTQRTPQPRPATSPARANRDAQPAVATTGVDASDADGDIRTVEAAAVSTSAPVTITGCLERSDEAFRLKDTDGANAPKARSWKSGFLKKSAASIDLVDAANRVKLSNHVGERISVTGTLVDRRMSVRSLQRVSASCSDGTKVKI